jgi:ABC-type transport system involved in multi-copper enzyme maturation permease subunit
MSKFSIYVRRKTIVTGRFVTALVSGLLAHLIGKIIPGKVIKLLALSLKLNEY